VSSGSLMPIVAAILISALLSGAIWCSGASEHGPQVRVLVCLGGMVAVTLLVRVLRHEKNIFPWDWRWGGPLLGLLALVAIQAVNASHHFLPGSEALVPQNHFHWLPRSVDAATTFGALLLLVGYAAAFWLARVWLNDRRARLTFVILQVACGTVMAVLVISQRSLPPPGALYLFTGAFINPNHYAAYANILLALALFWGLDCSADGWRRGRLGHAGWLLFPAAIILFTSVLRSGARMGAAVSLLVVSVVVIGFGLRMARNRWRLILTLGAAAGLVLLAAVAVWDKPLNTISRAARSLQQLFGNVTPRLDGQQVQGNVASRWAVNRAVAGMIVDRWATGVGAGTFGLAFPYYQPHSMSGFYRHAHNEYLQCVAELGILGSILLLWAACAMVLARPKINYLGQALSSRERWGIVLALGCLGLHAMTDFPLRLPALAFLMMTLVGLSRGQLFNDNSWMKPVSHEQTR